eukprot:12313664-Alexandrium_andersonii.AAC.1
MPAVSRKSATARCQVSSGSTAPAPKSGPTKNGAPSVPAKGSHHLAITTFAQGPGTSWRKAWPATRRAITPASEP